MGLSDSAASWGWPSRLLHWGMAGLILFQLGLGFRMVRLVDDAALKFGLYQTHKSWGFVIFLLALARVAWRAVQRRPDPPEGSGPLEWALARGAHLALYVLMLVLPLSGWLTASASKLQDDFGLPTMVFGWFTLPDPFQPGSKALEAALASAHSWAAFGMAVLLLAHAAAALRHHFVLRNGVLRRMGWRR